MWMILAGVGTLIPLGFSIIDERIRTWNSHTRFDRIYRRQCSPDCPIPFAVKVNHKLGLPGGPLITAS